MCFLTGGKIGVRAATGTQGHRKGKLQTQSQGHPQRPTQISSAMGWVDADGTDRFNFPQTIWIRPRIAMRATPRFGRASASLALSILSLAISEQGWRALEGKTSPRAMRLARLFHRDCLAELPSEGWCIPLETIREWLRTAGGIAP
jgi:hypothetical protein